MSITLIEKLERYQVILPKEGNWQTSLSQLHQEHSKTRQLEGSIQDLNKKMDNHLTRNALTVFACIAELYLATLTVMLIVQCMKRYNISFLKLSPVLAIPAAGAATAIAIPIAYKVRDYNFKNKKLPDLQHQLEERKQEEAQQKQAIVERFPTEEAERDLSKVTEEMLEEANVRLVSAREVRILSFMQRKQITKEEATQLVLQMEQRSYDLFMERKKATAKRDQMSLIQGKLDTYSIEELERLVQSLPDHV